MKNRKVVFLLLFLFSIRSFAQPTGNPPPYVNRLTNTTITINYGCQTQYSDYSFEFPAYRVSELSHELVYSLDTLSSILFDATSYDHPGLIKYGSYWKLKPGTITFDTISVSLDGSNANLDTGSDAIGFGVWYYTVTPPFPIEYHGQEKWTSINVVLDPNIQISGPEFYCSNPVSYDLENMPSSFTSSTWAIKQGEYTRASGSGTTASTSNMQYGPAQVEFTLHYSCGLKNKTLTKDFWVLGTPNNNAFYATLTTGESTDWLQDYNCLLTYTFPGMYSGDVDIITGNGAPIITEATWTKQSQTNCTFANVTPSDNGKHVSLNFKPFGCTAVVRMLASNDCGYFTNDYTFRAGESSFCSSEEWLVPPEIMIYPNPNSGKFTINYKFKDQDVGIQEIIVSNKSGSIILHEKYTNQKSVALDLSIQKNDNYFIDIFDGREWVCKQISKSN